MKKWLTRIGAIASLVSIVVAYNTWFLSWAPEWWIDGGYGLSYLLIYLTIWLGKDDWITRKIGRLGVMIAISNLLDNIYFNPLEFEMNEYICAAIIILVNLKDLLTIKIKQQMTDWDSLTEYYPENQELISGSEGVDWDWEAIYDSSQSIIGKRKKRK